MATKIQLQIIIANFEKRIAELEDEVQELTNQLIAMHKKEVL